MFTTKHEVRNLPGILKPYSDSLAKKKQSSHTTTCVQDQEEKLLRCNFPDVQINEITKIQSA